MDWTEKAVILWVTNWLQVCFFEDFLYDFMFLKNCIFDWCNRLVTRWYLL